MKLHECLLIVIVAASLTVKLYMDYTPPIHRHWLVYIGPVVCTADMSIYCLHLFHCTPSSFTILHVYFVPRSFGAYKDGKRYCKAKNSKAHYSSVLRRNEMNWKQIGRTLLDDTERNLEIAGGISVCITVSLLNDSVLLIASIIFNPA